MQEIGITLEEKELPKTELSNKTLIDNAWKNLYTGNNTADSEAFMYKVLKNEGEKVLGYISQDVLQEQKLNIEFLTHQTHAISKIADEIATEDSLELLISIALTMLDRPAFFDNNQDVPKLILDKVINLIINSKKVNHQVSKNLQDLYQKQTYGSSKIKLFNSNKLCAAIYQSGGTESKAFLLSVFSGPDQELIGTTFDKLKQIIEEYEKNNQSKNATSFTTTEQQKLADVTLAKQASSEASKILEGINISLSPAEAAIAKLIYYRYLTTGNLDLERYKQEIQELHKREIEDQNNPNIQPKGLELEIIREDKDIFISKTILDTLGIKSTREDASTIFEIKHSPTFSVDWQNRLLQEMTTLGFVDTDQHSTQYTRATLKEKQNLSLHVNFEIPSDVDKAIARIKNLDAEFVSTHYHDRQTPELKSRMDLLCFVLVCAYSSKERIMTRKMGNSWRANGKDGSLEQTIRNGKSRLEIRVPSFTHENSFLMLRELDVLVSAMFADFLVCNGFSNNERERLAKIWRVFENSLRFGQENWESSNKPEDTDLRRFFLKHDDGIRNNIGEGFTNRISDDARAEAIEFLTTTKARTEARQLMKKSYLQAKKL